MGNLVFDLRLCCGRNVFTHGCKAAVLRFLQVVAVPLVEHIELSCLAEEENTIALPHHRSKTIGQSSITPRPMAEDDLQGDPLEQMIELIHPRYRSALAVKSPVA